MESDQPIRLGVSRRPGPIIRLLSLLTISAPIAVFAACGTEVGEASSLEEASAQCTDEPLCPLLSTRLEGPLLSVSPVSTLPSTEIGSILQADSITYFTAGNAIYKMRYSNTNYVELVAGSSSSGNVDGTLTQARFKSPKGLALHPNGRWLYVADSGNNVVKVVDFNQKNVRSFWGSSVNQGKCSPTYGYCDGASWCDGGTVDSCISGLWCDWQYMTWNNAACSAVVAPYGLAIVASSASCSAGTGAEGCSGDVLIVSSRGEHTVDRVVGLSSGEFAREGRIAGTGQAGVNTAWTATETRLNQPRGIVAVGTPSSYDLFIADEWNHCVRKVSGSSIETVLGACGSQGNVLSCSPSAMRLDFPSDVAMEKGYTSSDDELFVADAMNYRILRVRNGVASLYAGVTDQTGYTEDGAALPAIKLRKPSALLSSGGYLYWGERAGGSTTPGIRFAATPALEE